MISLHSVLSLVDVISTASLTVVAVILLIAFSIGFVKGFRKVSWTGLRWATAALLFIGLCKKVPLTGSSVTRNMVVALLVGVVCVALTMVLYALLACALRPRIRWVKDDVNGDTSLAEYGLEFEPEYLDYDGEDDIAPYGKKIKKTGYNPPSLFGRLLGGGACMLNVGLWLFLIGAAFMLLVGYTSFNMWDIKYILDKPFFEKYLHWAKLYAFDVLAIGIMVLFAQKGYESGLIESLRALFIWALAIVGIVLAFYLPFSKFAQAETGAFATYAAFVNRCVVAFKGIGGAFGGILGKAFAGAIGASVVGMLVFIINVLFTKICNVVTKQGCTRTLDGVCGAAVYILIGAALCLAFWLVFGGFLYLSVIDVTELVAETEYLSFNMFEFAKGIVEKVLSPIFKK